MPNGFFYLNSLDWSISSKRGVWLVFIITWFTEITVLYANNVDPDQTLHFAVSDLGLHCLPMSHLRDTMLKCVKLIKIAFETRLDTKFYMKGQ